MLSSKNRFHRRNQVNYVYKAGKSVRGEVISLKYVTNQKHQSLRAGVVVSKKVAKSAVKRNRMRRRVYEAIRLLMPELKPGTDVLVSVFDESVATMPHDELSSTIKSLFSKAGLINN